MNIPRTLTFSMFLSACAAEAVQQPVQPAPSYTMINRSHGQVYERTTSYHDGFIPTSPTLTPSSTMICNGGQHSLPSNESTHVYSYSDFCGEIESITSPPINPERCAVSVPSEINNTLLDSLSHQAPGTGIMRLKTILEQNSPSSYQRRRTIPERCTDQYCEGILVYCNSDADRCLFYRINAVAGHRPWAAVTVSADGITTSNSLVCRIF